MEYGPGIVGHGELCTPAAAVADRRRAVHPSYLAYIEELARKLAACGLLEQNHRPPLCLSKNHCSLPLLRSAPTPATDFCAAKFQRLRRSAAEMGAPLGVLGGGYGTAEVGRDACVEHRPGSVCGGAYGGTSLELAYSRTLTKRIPAVSQVPGDPPPTYTLRRPVPSHPPVRPTTTVATQRRRSGTGVFLPRVNYDGNVGSAGQAGPRDSGRSGYDARGLHRQALEARAAVDSQRGTSYQAHASPPIELLLPKDWTY